MREIRAAPVSNPKQASVPLNSMNTLALCKQAVFWESRNVTQIFVAKLPKGLPCWERMTAFKIRILPIL